MRSLQELVIDSRADEVVYIDRIMDPLTDERQRKGDIMGLWYANEYFALYDLFYQKSDYLGKDYFYRCGRIDEFLIDKYDVRILDYGVSNIAYAVLSDNKNLIERYSKLSHRDYNWMVEKGHSTLLFVIQSSISKDWDKVKWGLNIMKTKNRKVNLHLEQDIIFFESLISKDESSALSSIQCLLKNHKKRNPSVRVASKYISIPALLYCKLAWLEGLNVQMNNPLILDDLLPFRPLEKYEDKYEFLKEIS